jgi:ABC-2 type transport system permease protein
LSHRTEFKPFVRVIWAGWIFSLKLTSLFQPIIFATIAFFMFKAGARSESLLYVALGAGIMGIWSSTLFGSGGMIQWERWGGTLEILVAAPAPLVMIVIPATLATSTIGTYSLTATIGWGRLFFDIPLDLAHPAMFFIALAGTIVGLGLMGLLLASTFVLYRNANAMSNLLEYPVWLVTGLLVPIALLPSWAEPISWMLAPTWGIKAIRAAALGGDPVGPILMTVGLGIVYLAIGERFLRYFEVRARESATLSLT